MKTNTRKVAIYNRLPEVVQNLLRHSVRKWLHILVEGYRDLGQANCALCIYFNGGKGWLADCEEYYSVAEEAGRPVCKCPVMTHSGKMKCENTPYLSWSRYLYRECFMFKNLHAVSKRVVDALSFELAKQELEYLAEFLPVRELLRKEVEEAIEKTYWSEDGNCIKQVQSADTAVDTGTAEQSARPC